MKRTFTISQKVTGLVGILLVLFMTLGAVTLVNLAAIVQSAAALQTHDVPALESVGFISAKLYRVRGDSWKHMATTDAAVMEKVELEMRELDEELSQQMVNYERTIQTEADRDAFQKLRQSVTGYRAAWKNVAVFSRSGDKPHAVDLYMRTAQPPFETARDLLLEMQKSTKAAADASSESTARSARTAKEWTWIFLVSAFTAGGTLSFFLLRGINLALTRLIERLGSRAAQAAEFSRNIATSSQSLAQACSGQAAALEETSASGEEINVMAQRNTENALAAANSMTRAQQMFDVANESLLQVVSAIDGINLQSGRISNIIKIIDEIAFQTNMLALNAAVEAARAGEAGMGFAVVAEEVRNLAQRCAQAARDTTVMIEGSIVQSKGGKERVDRLTRVLAELTGENSRVKALIDGVSVSSEEQARGISQIAQSIVEMQQLNQQTAATSEESASAANELRLQSSELNQVAQGLTAIVTASAVSNS